MGVAAEYLPLPLFICKIGLMDTQRFWLFHWLYDLVDRFRKR